MSFINFTYLSFLAAKIKMSNRSPNFAFERQVIRNPVRSLLQLVGAGPTYGYRTKDGRLETNPQEMKIARLIVELREWWKLSFRKIVEELDHRGYRNRRGGRWNRVSVRQGFVKWARKV